MTTEPITWRSASTDPPDDGMKSTALLLSLLPALLLLSACGGGGPEPVPDQATPVVLCTPEICK
jgi:hypothetical protein